MQKSITILLVNTLILILLFNRIQSEWSEFYGGLDADTKSFIFSSIATDLSYITKICVGTSPILHNIQTTFNNNDSSGFHGANTTNNDSISCYSVHPSHCFVSVTLFVAGCDHCSIHVLQFRSSAGEWGPYWGQHVDNSGTTYTVEANTDECISKINIEYDTNNIRRIRFYFESFNTSAPTTAIPSNSPTNNPTNPTISPTSGCYGTHDGLSWNDASAFCQSVCDSNLSSIHSLSDFNVIAAVLSSNNIDDKAWIGLNGYYILDEYIWSDSTPMDYGTIFGLYPWAQSEPNGNINDRCVAMHSVYGWYDEDCDKLYPFICGSAIQLSLTPTTSYPSFHPTYSPTFYPTETPSNIPTSAPFSSTEGELQVSTAIQLHTVSVEDMEPNDDQPTNDTFTVFVSIGGSIICCVICAIAFFNIYKIRAERENSKDAAAKQRPQISASPYVDSNDKDIEFEIGSSLVELQSDANENSVNNVHLHSMEDKEAEGMTEIDKETDEEGVVVIYENASDNNQWKRWNPIQTLNWILSIENGIFKVYEHVLRQEIDKIQLKGEDLIALDLDDFRSLGIDTFEHRKLLRQNILKCIGSLTSDLELSSDEEEASIIDEKETIQISAVKLQMIEANDNDIEKEDVILDQMLSDIVEMQKSDPNKIHQINVNNVVNHNNDDSDSDDSDHMYQNHK